MTGRALLLLASTAVLLGVSSGMLAGIPLSHPINMFELMDICREQGVQNPNEIPFFMQHTQCLANQYFASANFGRNLDPGADPNDVTKAWCAEHRDAVYECLPIIVKFFEQCRNASERADDQVGAWQVAFSNVLDFLCDAEAGRVSAFYAGDGAQCATSWRTSRILGRCVADFGVQSGHDTAVLLRGFTAGNCRLIAILGDCIAGSFRYCENSRSATVIQGMMDVLMAGLPCEKYSLRREPEPLSLSERALLC